MASTDRIDGNVPMAAARPTWARWAFRALAGMGALFAVAFGALVVALVVGAILMATVSSCPPDEVMCEDLGKGFAGPVFVVGLVLVLPTLAFAALTRRAWRAARA